jgi:hypothetical protein
MIGVTNLVPRQNDHRIKYVDYSKDYREDK